MNFAAVTPRRLMTGTIALLLSVGVIAIPAESVKAAALPGGFSERVVFSGLVNPTGVEFAANGQVFVAEKSGIIKVFDSLTDTSPSVFADLRTSVHNYWDRGLLGLALHPDYPTDPRVYVLYTYDGLIGGSSPKWGAVNGTSDPCPTPPGPTSDGCQVSGRLSALIQTGSTIAEQVLIEDWCQQFPSHSVGAIAFGPDAMLYATGGDGASFNYVDYGQDSYPTSDVTPDNPCGDPPSPVGTALAPPSAEGGALRSQDLRTGDDPLTLDGSLIRIDPDTGDAAADNPLAGSSDPNARRIVAHGLRNPFRFTVRPGTSEIWIGDVGWRSWEEINRVAVGSAAGISNFGWPCYEGASRQPGYENADLTLCQNLYAAGTGAVKAPYFAYHHNAKVVAGETCGTGGSSIAGLAFYPGGNYPAEYDGALFFADYSRKCVWAMRPGAGGLPNPADIVTFASGYGVTGLRAGPGGDIFAVDYDNGRIVRYVYSATNNAPTALIKAEPTSGLAPLTVSFDGTGSNDADGDPLTYVWDLDGDGQYDDSTSATVQHTYTTNGKVNVGLRVTDSKGAGDTAAAEISVGNTAPIATITGPSPGITWRVGDAIGFSGTAVDSQDGTLSGSALTWTLVMHHCPSNCHAHEITTTTGTSGSFIAPDHEYPSYLELRLTAEDSGGLRHTTSVRLDPKTVDLTFVSQPSGLRLTYLAETAGTPFTRRAIVGSSGSISVELVQTLGDRAYHFAAWTDGGTRTHNFTAPDSATTYTALYRTKRNPQQWPVAPESRPVTVSSFQASGSLLPVSGRGAESAGTADVQMSAGVLDSAVAAVDPVDCLTASGDESLVALRYAGPNRYETAVCVSYWTWYDHDDPEADQDFLAHAVVLARGDNFPDALAGGPLAAFVQGPLLLTPPSALRAEVMAEIQRVLAPGGTVYLLGGTSSVSNAIRDQLEAAGYLTERLAGPNRYETAIAIADELPDTSNFFFATGTNYPDALAAGTAASALTYVSRFDSTIRPFALLLTNDDQMPTSTFNFADARGQQFGEWTLVPSGGWATRAVTDAFGQENIAVSFAGPNRYATATEIAEGIFTVDGVLVGAGVGLATGLNFPDALAATPMLAMFAQPLLLTHPDQLSAATRSFLQDHAGQGLYIDVFGGPTTVTPGVVTEALTVFD